MSQQSRDLEENAYVFGPFRLIPRRQTLLRGGSPVRIGGRALDILTLLVSRKGDIVSKRELLDFAWPGTFVHEANLKVNIVALRRALSADPDDYIATVAGRGYRFIANVATERDNRSTIVRSEGRRSRPLPRLPDLIGRDGEVLKIREALSAARNVTIVGPGGVGKTSVALAVAHAESAAFPDGVFHIDLSTVGDTQYALAAIASGVAARPGSEDTISEIVSALCDRQNLVILDNCEHLSPTISSIVSRLLDALPATKFLATSREPLWVVPELVYRLPSLELPPEGDIVTAREAMAFGAVQLFVSRAYNRGGYELTDADAPLVAATCRRLDGIALAIELAASKANAIGVAELLATLEQRFLLLSNGDRFAPLRQQTMRIGLQGNIVRHPGAMTDRSQVLDGLPNGGQPFANVTAGGSAQEKRDGSPRRDAVLIAQTQEPIDIPTAQFELAIPVSKEAAEGVGIADRELVPASDGLPDGLFRRGQSLRDVPAEPLRMGKGVTDVAVPAVQEAQEAGIARLLQIALVKP